MRALFPEFCKPSEEELKKIWTNAIFVFDTSILLGLYRLPRKLRINIISKLEKLGDRAWIPHQVAMEYYRSRLEVIHEQGRKYQEFLCLLEDCEKEVEARLKEYGRHPFIDNKGIILKIVKSYKVIRNDLAKIKQKQPDWSNSDEIEAALNNIFKKDRVGKEYDSKRLQDIYSEGQVRYEKEIPPGYKDKKKDSEDKTGTRKFGDLIIWFQIIDKAIESKKPIIFVTAEKKEDWWYSIGGKNVGARYELIMEVKNKANVSFLMYQSDHFIEHASKYLDIKFNKELIEEVKKLRSEIMIEKQVLVKSKEDLSASSKISPPCDIVVAEGISFSCQDSPQTNTILDKSEVGGEDANKVGNKVDL